MSAGSRSPQSSWHHQRASHPEDYLGFKQAMAFAALNAQGDNASRKGYRDGISEQFLDRSSFSALPLLSTNVQKRWPSAFHPLQPLPDLPRKISALLLQRLSDALKRAGSRHRHRQVTATQEEIQGVQCEVGPPTAPVKNDDQSLIISRRFSTMSLRA